MILEEIQRQIESQRSGEFIYPLYKSYCLSNIPSAVLSLFGLKKTNPLSGVLHKAGVNNAHPKKVVLFLIDGFGYNQWLRYAGRYEFLRRFTERGVVSPITTVFPSTTAAAITTINSGVTPQEHGLPEWWVYFEELDKIITTLLFTPLGEEGRDKLLDAGVNPKILFNKKTLHRVLSESKIPSFSFIREAYSQSAYSKVAHDGSQTIPFISASELMVNLRKKISETPSSSYFYVYWDAIDSIAHKYGPHTEQYLAELNGFFHLLQEEFVQKMDKQAAEETVILITADHGQVNIEPKETIYLNQYPDVVKNFQTGANGNKILPWGSPRDVFLAIKKEKQEEVLRFLTKVLEGKAMVMRTQTALDANMFGQGLLHKKFKSRVGDILILPYKNSTVWYEHFKDEKFDLRGMHGGLSPDEILVPFAVAKAASLL